MEGYPITARIAVRWRDIDALGHVNNAVYFTYFEIARGRYFDSVFRRSAFPGLTCILAAVRCDFLQPICHGDVIDVGVRVPAVSHTSFDFAYEAQSAENGQAVARAHSVQVLYNRLSKEKITITGKWLAAITRAQGKQPRCLKKVTI